MLVSKYIRANVIGTYLEYRIINVRNRFIDRREKISPLVGMRLMCVFSMTTNLCLPNIPNPIKVKKKRRQHFFTRSFAGLVQGRALGTLTYNVFWPTITKHEIWDPKDFYEFQWFRPNQNHQSKSNKIKSTLKSMICDWPFWITYRKKAYLNFCFLNNLDHCSFSITINKTLNMLIFFIVSISR